MNLQLLLMLFRHLLLLHLELLEEDLLLHLLSVLQLSKQNKTKGVERAEKGKRIYGELA